MILGITKQEWKLFPWKIILGGSLVLTISLTYLIYTLEGICK